MAKQKSKDKAGNATIAQNKAAEFNTVSALIIERVRLLGTSWALTRSYGFKLEHALYRPAGDYGRAAAVAIGWSLKRWRD